jgi:hypothetical protein
MGHNIGVSASYYKPREHEVLKDEQIQSLVKKQEKFEQLIQTLIDSGQLKPNTKS